jgi:hypothetical protein
MRQNIEQKKNIAQSKSLIIISNNWANIHDVMYDEHECGRIERKRSTKGMIDSVRQDLREMKVSDVMTTDRGQ